MTTQQFALLLILAGVPVASCTTTPARTAAEGLEDPSCALDVPATVVAVRDTSHGAVVVFTNKTDKVSALQRRVRELADLQRDPNRKNDPNVVKGAQAATQLVVDGALLRLTPRGDRSLAELRRDARDLAVRLANTPCRQEDTFLPSLPPSYPVL